MYSPFQLSLKYLRYFLTAANGKGHGTHSPFVFEFITRILNDRSDYPAYEQVERLRRKLKQDRTLLEVEDYGAGSVQGKSQQRSVAAIARAAAKPPKYGQLLHRMVRYYQPSTIIEMGTSLGITTHYLALGNPEAKVYTMEGAPELVRVAGMHFSHPGMSHIRQVAGNFDHTLADLLQKGVSPDFVFIDGNHRQEPTERYFRQLLSAVQPDSILVFDDIHWSAEMEAAWRTIRQAPQVRCSIDLFFIGIVFFRTEFKEKLDFVIRY